jgi:hypothetical protein
MSASTLFTANTCAGGLSLLATAAPSITGTTAAGNVRGRAPDTHTLARVDALAIVEAR